MINCSTPSHDPDACAHLPWDPGPRVNSGFGMRWLFAAPYLWYSSRSQLC